MLLLWMKFHHGCIKIKTNLFPKLWIVASTKINCYTMKTRQNLNVYSIKFLIHVCIPFFLIQINTCLDPTNHLNSATSLCLSQAMTRISNVIYIVVLFNVQWVVIVCSFHNWLHTCQYIGIVPCCRQHIHNHRHSHLAISVLDYTVYPCKHIQLK